MQNDILTDKAMPIDSKDLNDKLEIVVKRLEQNVEGLVERNKDRYGDRWLLRSIKANVFIRVQFVLAILRKEGFFLTLYQTTKF